jgi:hypothetical protein
MLPSSAGPSPSPTSPAETPRSFCELLLTFGRGDDARIRGIGKRLRNSWALSPVVHGAAVKYKTNNHQNSHCFPLPKCTKAEEQLTLNLGS